MSNVEIVIPNAHSDNLNVSKNQPDTKSKLTENLIIDLLRYDISKLSISPTITTYKKFPYYQMQFGTPSNQYKDLFMLRVKTNNISIKNNIISIFTDKELTGKPQVQKYINSISYLDKILVNNKAQLFDRLKTKGLRSHPDLYLHVPIIQRTKEKIYFDIALSKDKTNNQIVTFFTLDKFMSLYNQKEISSEKALSEYKNHKYAIIIFKALARFSKDGDFGARRFTIRLIATKIHLGDEVLTTNSDVQYT